MLLPRYVEQLEQLYERNKSIKPLKWRTLHWQAELALLNGKKKQALNFATKALQAIDTLRYEYDYQRLKRIMIKCAYHELSPLDKYKAYRKQLSYYDKIHDDLYAANACTEIGNLFHELEDHKKSIVYHLRADSLYKLINSTQSVLKNSLNLVNDFANNRNRAKANQLIDMILNSPVAKADTSFYLQALASAFSLQKDISKRKIIALRAYSLAKQFGERRPMIPSYINYASSLMATNRLDSAYQILAKTESLLSPSDLNYRTIVYNGLSYYFHNSHRSDSAYIYLLAYNQLKDSIRNNTLGEIYRIENIVAIENYEKDLLRERQKAESQRLFYFLLMGMTVIVAASICYALFMQHRKDAHKRQIKELENKELSTRLENEELRHKMELDHKNRQLASNAMILNEKNNVLSELAERISKRKEAGEISPATAIELKSRIRVQSASETTNWIAFKKHFDEVHPDFFIHLKDNCIELTEYDLRLCAYLSVGMERRQIAMLLSILPASVKRAVMRIRKKLALKPTDSLEDYLRRI